MTAAKDSAAVVALLACVAGPSRAADTAAGLAAPEPLAAGSLLQLFLGLVLVLALIVASAWLLRRLGRFQSAAGGSLRVLGGLSMGTRERVVLIQAGDTQLLLGVAPGRVQTLHVFDEAVQVAPAAEADNAFASRLKSVLGKEVAQ